MRRLPDPAQRVARRAWAAAAGLRHQATRRRFRSRPEAGADAQGAGSPALEGRATEDMVRAAWSGAGPWLVAIPGSPADVRDARVAAAPRRSPTPAAADRSPTTSPTSPTWRPSATPATGTWWSPRAPGPGSASRRSCATTSCGPTAPLADEPDAGTVFDLTYPAEPGPARSGRRSSELTAGLGRAPAVLDCTGLDLRAGAARPGHVRAARRRSPALPRRQRRRGGGRGGTVTRARPAGSPRLGVITVAAGGTGRRRPVGRRLSPRHGGLRRRGYWCGRAQRPTRAGSPPWPSGSSRRAPASSLAPIDTAAPRQARRPRRGGGGGAARAPAPRHDPAAAAAAAGRSRLGRGRQGAARRRPPGVGGRDRVLRPLGGADRRRRLRDVRAPWHDYVRPVCWAPGLVAAAAPPLDRCAGASGSRRGGPTCGSGAPPSGRRAARSSTTPTWPRCGSPATAASRRSPSRRPPGSGSSTCAPAGRRELSDGAWRYLLAHDDVEACRG